MALVDRCRCGICPLCKAYEQDQERRLRRDIRRGHRRVADPCIDPEERRLAVWIGPRLSAASSLDAAARFGLTYTILQ